MSARRAFSNGSTMWKFLIRSSSDITVTGNRTWKTPQRPSEAPLTSRISGPELSHAIPACHPSGPVTSKSPFSFGHGPGHGVPIYPSVQPSRSERAMTFCSL